jgi:signal recognition particle receptor subunit beta
MAVEFTNWEELSSNPIKICIVGHTNHGKTSTIRTLTEDKSLGTVSNSPDTTTCVDHFSVMRNGFPVFYVTDTPGFTNLDLRLAEYKSEIGRTPTIEEFSNFMNSKKVSVNQNIDNSISPDDWLRRTLVEIKNSHLLLLILDSREDTTSNTYLSEIEFLKSCGVPLIISLNFIYTKDTKKLDWRKVIGKIGVHTIIEFDAHTRNWDQESDLFNMIIPLLHNKLYKSLLLYWNDLRETEFKERAMGAAIDISKLISDLSNHETFVTGVNSINKSEKEVLAELKFKEFVTATFDVGARKISDRYGFNWDEFQVYINSPEGQKMAQTFDFFDNSTLKLYAALATAATLAAFEVLIGGMTFGIPTLIGTTITYITVSAFKSGREGDGSVIVVSPTIDMVNLVAIRAIGLARTLKSRGKANDKKIDFIDDKLIPKSNKELMAEIRKIFEKVQTKTDLLEELLLKAIIK